MFKYKNDVSYMESKIFPLLHEIAITVHQSYYTYDTPIYPEIDFTLTKYKQFMEFFKSDDKSVCEIKVY